MPSDRFAPPAALLADCLPVTSLRHWLLQIIVGLVEEDVKGGILKNI